MCSPEDLMFRIKPSEFTLFHVKDLNVYVQNDLVEPGELNVVILYKGKFQIVFIE